MVKVFFIGEYEQFEKDVIPELESNGFEVKCYTHMVQGILPKEDSQLVMISLEQRGGDGIELCSELREQAPEAYLAIVSGPVEPFVKVAAIEAGADDYFQFPMSKRFLIAKLLAWVRKRQQKEIVGHPNEEFQGLRINRENFTVHVGNVQCDVPKKEFEILSLLIAEPRKVFTREQIKKRTWNSGEVVRDRTIDVHIRKLREKIGERYIKTIRGVGYKLEV